MGSKYDIFEINGGIVSPIFEDGIEVLNKQQQKVQEDILKLKSLETMIGLRIEQISLGNEVLQKTVPEFSVIELEKEVPLYLGEKIDCTWDEITDDMVIEFYSKCERLGFPMIFSNGQMKSRENILSGGTEIISNIYILNISIKITTDKCLPVVVFNKILNFKRIFCIYPHLHRSIKIQCYIFKWFINSKCI